MLKSKTPVTDRPLPEFQEMQKNKYFPKKKLSFYMGGVVKTENRLLFAKKHSTKGVLKNCKDVPCKITTFEETNANDIGCAKVKVAILHGRS